MIRFGIRRVDKHGHIIIVNDPSDSKKLEINNTNEEMRFILLEPGEVVIRVADITLTDDEIEDMMYRTPMIIGSFRNIVKAGLKELRKKLGGNE